MATTPTQEPAQIRAGDSLTWLITLDDYSAADGWALKYTLVKQGTRITINAAAQGADFLVTLAAATTAAYAAGKYDYIGRVSKGADAYTVRTGQIEILANVETQAGGYDGRSHARKTLDALEAWIEGRDIGVAEYQINGRQLKTIPIPDLLAMRDRYRLEVRSEQHAADITAGRRPKNTLYVRL